MNNLLINTPQNVKFEYKLASVASRAIAFAIDYGIMLLYIFFLIFIFTYFDLFSQLDNWSSMGLISLLTLPLFFYPLISETLMNGQTIGKKIMKIRVVKIDGSRATFYQYFIRWVSNTVDIFLTSGGLALASIILSKKSQRIGDIAADTTVIDIKNNLILKDTLFAEITQDYKVQFPEVIKLTDQDINEIKSIYKTGQMRRNQEILIALATKIEILIGRKSNLEPQHFIPQIISDHYYTFSE